MAQVFPPHFALLLKLTLSGAAVFIVVVLIVYRLNARSDPAQFSPIVQPVPFSHKHHVRDDGIDCRYCHSSVENSAFAGVPSLATCMTCHSQLFRGAAVLAPVADG